ncbi:MAG: phosphatase PAP2 family protein [Chitinophagaceae bacterium]|nr:phosphatase PAP2 family protein [Chitinophagaceae bacterium]
MVQPVTNKKGILKISLKLVLTGILFLVCLFTFSLIAHEAVLEKEEVFDNKVFSFFSSFSSPGFINLMEIFTFFGSSTFLLSAYVVIIGFFFIRKQYRYGIDIAIIALSSTGLMYVLKQIFHRQRPDLPIIKGITSYSFPSGHTLSSFIFCSILVYIIYNSALQKWLKWLLSVFLVLFAITIGMSRIVLKAHFPTDVAASFCLGIIWVILAFWLLRKIGFSKYNTAKKKIS